MVMRRVLQHALGDGSRVRRAIRAALLTGAFALAASAVNAEPYVLVYSEGSVVTLPGGATVSKGEQIEAEKLVQLGPADYAIFVSQAGNVVHLDGPYCGSLVSSMERQSDKGLFGMFGGKASAPKPQGCPK
jgi:hypothetical protein